MCINIYIYIYIYTCTCREIGRRALKPLASDILSFTPSSPITNIITTSITIIVTITIMYISIAIITMTNATTLQ